METCMFFFKKMFWVGVDGKGLSLLDWQVVLTRQITKKKKNLWLWCSLKIAGDCKEHAIWFTDSLGDDIICALSRAAVERHVDCS